MPRTGVKVIQTLRKYVNGVRTSETKTNEITDQSHIDKYYDFVNCKVRDEDVDETTTTAAPTTTTTTAAPTTSTTSTTTTTTVCTVGDEITSETNMIANLEQVDGDNSIPVSNPWIALGRSDSLNIGTFVRQAISFASSSAVGTSNTEHKIATLIIGNWNEAENGSDVAFDFDAWIETNLLNGGTLSSSFQNIVDSDDEEIDVVIGYGASAFTSHYIRIKAGSVRKVGTGGRYDSIVFAARDGADFDPTDYIDGANTYVRGHDATGNFRIWEVCGDTPATTTTTTSTTTTTTTTAAPTGSTPNQYSTRYFIGYTDPVKTYFCNHYGTDHWLYNQLLWHDGTGSFPAVGDNAYFDQEQTKPFTTANGGLVVVKILYGPVLEINSTTGAITRVEYC